MVLEDDRELRRLVAGRLRTEGHSVDEVATLSAARQALAANKYDCLVLDRVVPDGDAIHLVAEMYDRAEHVPMLVLSGLDGPNEQAVEGLLLGADDYMTKPVRLDELALRVRNLGSLPTRVRLAPLHVGRVTIDRMRRRVTIDDTPVHVTPHQFAVVAYLAADRWRLVTTEELLDHCWDDQRDLFANPLHSQIVRLRHRFRGALRFDSVGLGVPPEGRG